MNNNHNNRFMDGFLLGAIVGGAAVFLLGTKKGNKVLKAITEEGLDGLTDLIENLEEMEKGTKPLPKVKKVVAPAPEEVEEVIELEKPAPVSHSNGFSNGSSVNHAKRFFKRTK